MIKTDKYALICDLAETYSIYDYRSLPCSTVATLSVGLRADSRIKLKFSGMKIPQDTLLLAAISDATRLILWGMSKDGRKNRNRPPSVLKAMLGEEEKEEYLTFENGESFMRMWDSITQRKDIE